MEDVELPSLPSIQPNLDYDSGIETSEGYTEQDEVDEVSSIMNITNGRQLLIPLGKQPITRISPPAAAPIPLHPALDSPAPPAKTLPTCLIVPVPQHHTICPTEHVEWSVMTTPRPLLPDTWASPAVAATPVDLAVTGPTSSIHQARCRSAFQMGVAVMD